MVRKPTLGRTQPQPVARARGGLSAGCPANTGAPASLRYPVPAAVRPAPASAVRGASQGTSQLRVTVASAVRWAVLELWRDQKVNCQLTGSFSMGGPRTLQGRAIAGSFLSEHLRGPRSLQSVSFTLTPPHQKGIIIPIF